MDEQMTLDGSSRLEKTQHREAIPVLLNEEILHHAGELGTNCGMLPVHDWKIESPLWWSSVCVCVCSYDEKMRVQKHFLFLEPSCWLFIFLWFKKTKKANSLYIQENSDVYVKALKQCSIVLNQVFARVALALLDLLVKFLCVVDKTTKFSFKVAYLKSESNVWKYIFYVV